MRCGRFEIKMERKFDSELMHFGTVKDECWLVLSVYLCLMTTLPMLQTHLHIVLRGIRDAFDTTIWFIFFSSLDTRLDKYDNISLSHVHVRQNCRIIATMHCKVKMNRGLFYSY